MSYTNVAKPFTNKQLEYAVSLLITEIMNIKACWPDYPCLTQNPRIKGLIQTAEKWADIILAMEGDL